MRKALALVAVAALVGSIGFAGWKYVSPDVAEVVFTRAAGDDLVLVERVTDKAGLLSEAEEAALSKRLAAFEGRTRHQLVVVTVPTLNGQDVADYTRALANRSGIGRKSHHDGIVLLVAPNERKVRLAVNYGLEQALPNAMAARILQEDVLPQFRAGDYPAGINAGVTAIITRLPVEGG